MPTFSVIIPLYNGARFIRAALDRVFAQTFSDFEAVVVDDGSKDDGAGAAIVEELARKDRRLRLIRQQNKGLGGARNSAIAASSGRLLALLDQDDLWYPKKLAAVKEAFDRDPGVSIVCHREIAVKDGEKLRVMDYGPAEADMFRAMLFTGNRLSTSAAVFKREVVEKIGLFSEDVRRLHFLEDYDYWLRAARAGFKFAFLKQALGECTQHEGNFSSNEELMCRNTLAVMDAHYAALSPRRWLDPYRFRRQRSRVCIDSAYLQLKSGAYGASAKSLLRAARENPLFVDSLAGKLKSGLGRCCGGRP